MTDKITLVVPKRNLNIAIDFLAEESTRFVVEPLPFDEYEVSLFGHPAKHVVDALRCLLLQHCGPEMEFYRQLVAKWRECRTDAEEEEVPLCEIMNRDDFEIWLNNELTRLEG